MSDETPTSGPAAARERDNPWIFRTYAGHSTAADSNALYRSNLARGQTGLSVAFDLPTQTGYDADHELARGEVGKVGVPVGHLGDMRALFDGIPLEQMNTSMTINATAAWLLSLYIAAAEEQGADISKLQGTTQNDIIKEYLSRGTYIFPPAPSMRLIADMITYTYDALPKWNPMNVCSYHLQEAGATPVQEIAYALSTACAVLDQVKASGQVPEKDFPRVVGRLSFFVNAGIRFIEEMCKMRAFARLWHDTTGERYGVSEDRFRRFRYGVQVNSLGLTEQQPENNVYRILLEMLAVTLSKDARARAVQLPAWNEALGLPRPWDQQWSLRMQHILAFETDLLEYNDIFNGSHVIEQRTDEIMAAAVAEFRRIDEMGGAVAAIESAYMKKRLVDSNTERVKAIESGRQTVVGVNRFTESAPSPLSAGEEDAFLTVSPHVEAAQIERLKAWKASRDQKAAEQAIADLRAAAQEGRNIMPVSIAAAKAGVTTGEWAGTLREVFGEFRAPTGVTGSAPLEAGEDIDAVRKSVDTLSKKLGRRVKLLVAKPGLDGHSSGAEQIAVRARDVGMEVVYEGIRQTPAQIVNAAVEESVHAIGLSILSGSHMPIVESIMSMMREEGIGDVPVILGGIIPAEDEPALLKLGIARIYTPKNYKLTGIMSEIVDLIGERS